MGSPRRTISQSVQRLQLTAYQNGILSQDRVVLSRAITLVESRLEADQHMADKLIQSLLPQTGNSLRIGITGVPGVGKSTFIDVFGKFLTSINKRVAVLAIDPSSMQTGGSILGDKTRMELLSKDPNAFIRPTATGTHLGGVANKTREAILLCEAAGYDIIIVETVGVGQSEVAVKEVVDFFLLLMLSGAGDELQGIKKGIMEMADGLIITKADGDNLQRARRAQAEYQQALHFLAPAASGWNTKVLISSAKENKGINEVWEMIEDFFQLTKKKGLFEEIRSQQNLMWLRNNMEAKFRREILQSEKLAPMLIKYEKMIVSNEITAGEAARKLWAEFLKTF
jgi:LAO/AO transport system kinase